MVTFGYNRQKNAIARDLQEQLGNQYDVVEKDDHIHIEYDPS